MQVHIEHDMTGTGTKAKDPLAVMVHVFIPDHLVQGFRLTV